ncbi:MAG: LysR family transcriptional regulator, partial [Frankiales bacterium]|nr:LysR family transcriptional regulator [Frankiales bacterium]
AAVAVHLQMTPPGVSMQLAALEREAGLPRTERRGRRVVLTAAGKGLARHGHDLADMVAVAEMELATLREGRTGTYRLAAFPTAARSFVADAWRGLLSSSDNGLALHVVECEPQDALPTLAEGTVDLAVTHSYSNVAVLPSPALVADPLAVEEVLLAVPAEAGAGALSSGALPPVALGDYAHHDWVLPHSRWTCHEMVQRACGAAGFAPRPVAEATDCAVQLALVAAGVGVALVPQLGCTDIPGGVELRRLRDPVHRTLFTVTRSTSRGDLGLLHVRHLLHQAVAAAGMAPLGGHGQPSA